MNRFISPVFAAAIVAAATGTPAAAECIADWGKAAEIVKSEKLKTIEDLANAKTSVIQGQIVRATLCRESGTYTYQLVVRDSAGAMKNVVLDAYDPAKPAMSRK